MGEISWSAFWDIPVKIPIPPPKTTESIMAAAILPKLGTLLGAKIFGKGIVQALHDFAMGHQGDFVAQYQGFFRVMGYNHLGQGIKIRKPNQQLLDFFFMKGIQGGGGLIH